MLCRSVVLLVLLVLHGSLQPVTEAGRPRDLPNRTRQKQPEYLDGDASLCSRGYFWVSRRCVSSAVTATIPLGNAAVEVAVEQRAELGDDKDVIGSGRAWEDHCTRQYTKYSAKRKSRQVGLREKRYRSSCPENHTCMDVADWMWRFRIVCIPVKDDDVTSSKATVAAGIGELQSVEVWLEEAELAMDEFRKTFHRRAMRPTRPVPRYHLQARRRPRPSIWSQERPRHGVDDEIDGRQRTGSSCTASSSGTACLADSAQLVEGENRLSLLDDPALADLDMKWEGDLDSRTT